MELRNTDYGYRGQIAKLEQRLREAQVWYKTTGRLLRVLAPDPEARKDITQSRSL